MKKNKFTAQSLVFAAVVLIFASNGAFAQPKKAESDSKISLDGLTETLTVTVSLR